MIASFTYTLDGNGNRIGIDKQIPTTSPLPIRNETADYTHNRINSAGTASFTHDNEGQLATKEESGTTTYSFDDAHRLTGISGASNDLYSYDGAGNRLKAIRDGVETRYIYDSNENLLAEADSNNVITRYYIHGAGLLAAVTPTDDLYCYHYDAIGSTVAITDVTESIINSYDYTPFGIIVNESETFSQPFKYVGSLGVMAEVNGFYYMRVRYYAPVIGRFTSEDPLGFDGGDVNLYVYGANNPMLYSDPSGLWTFQIGYSITTGGLFGSTKGAGFIVGRNPQTRKWQFGWYAMGGAGAFGGASASGVIDFTWSGNPNIEDVGGTSTTAGGSGTIAGISIGGETNTPLSGRATNSYTFSLGGSVGMPGEGHGYITHTKVNRFGGSHKP